MEGTALFRWIVAGAWEEVEEVLEVFDLLVSVWRNRAFKGWGFGGGGAMSCVYAECLMLNVECFVLNQFQSVYVTHKSDDHIFVFTSPRVSFKLSRGGKSGGGGAVRSPSISG